LIKSKRNDAGFSNLAIFSSLFSARACKQHMLSHSVQSDSFSWISSAFCVILHQNGRLCHKMVSEDELTCSCYILDCLIFQKQHFVYSCVVYLPISDSMNASLFSMCMCFLLHVWGFSTECNQEKKKNQMTWKETYERKSEEIQLSDEQECLRHDDEKVYSHDEDCATIYRWQKWRSQTLTSAAYACFRYTLKSRNILQITMSRRIRALYSIHKINIDRVKTLQNRKNWPRCRNIMPSPKNW
jgi:hypothetical protein